MKTVIAVSFALFAIASQAAEPAYWMKSYTAPQAKVDQCLVVAQEAYEKAHKGGMDGHFVAILYKGLAWEKCMESK